jgi:hypothetical protein
MFSSIASKVTNGIRASNGSGIKFNFVIPSLVLRNSVRDVRLSLSHVGAARTFFAYPEPMRPKRLRRMCHPPSGFKT